MPPAGPGASPDEVLHYYEYVAYLLHREGYCYPNANYGAYLTEAAVREAWRHTARLIEQGTAPSRLTGYLHVPFCSCACIYCMSGSIRMRPDHDVLGRYLARLVDDLEAFAEPLRDHELTAVYVGGGSPSLLDCSQIEALLAALRRNYRCTDATRITFEASPFTMDRAKLALLERLGVHELSLGVQSFDAEVLRRNHRPQPVAHTVELIRQAVASGIPSTTIDIMVGMPYQSTASALESVRRAIDLDVDGVMLNEFLPLSHIRFCREGHRYSAAEHAEKRRALRASRRLLQQAGYQLTSSGYRRRWTEEDEQRAYHTQETANLIGFGYGAYSHAWGSLQVQQLYPFDRLVRSLGAEAAFPPSSGDNFRAMFRAKLGAKYDRMLADTDGEPLRYVGLPMSIEREMHVYAYSQLFQLSRSAFSQRFGKTLDEVFGSQLEWLRHRGLLEPDGDCAGIRGGDEVTTRVVRALFVDDAYVRAMIDVADLPYDPCEDYARRIREVTRSMLSEPAD